MKHAKEQLKPGRGPWDMKETSPTHPKAYGRWIEYGPALLLAFMLLFRLGAAPLYILDEVKNAQCAREMWLRADRVVPTFNAELRTDKPVLHYLAMQASFSRFGFSPFSARLFSAVCGIACILLLQGFTRRLIDARTAFNASMALALSTHWIFEFRLAVPDPYLILFSTSGLLCGYAWIEGKGQGHLYLSALSLGLATLSKGPVAIALPGLCLLTWVAIRGRWPLLKLSNLIPATVLFLAVAMPWYRAVHLSTDGEWTRGFFMKHNLQRFSSPMEGHGGAFILPVVFVALGLLPLSLFSREVYRLRASVFSEPFLRFCLIVLAAHLVFFSLSATKLPNYAMPAYPFAAVILGKCLSLLTGKGGRGLPAYVDRMLNALLWLLPFAGVLALGAEPATADLKAIPFWLIVAPMAMSALKLAQRRGIVVKPLVPLAIGWLTFNAVGLHWLYPLVYQRNPVSLSAVLIAKSDSVASFGIYNPAYHILLDGPVRRFEKKDSLHTWLDRNPDAVVLTRSENVDSLREIGLRLLTSHRDLFERPTSAVMGK